MKWRIVLPPWPRVFGWDALAFTDRLKLMGFLAQAGGGVAMTVLAAYALIKEAQANAIWPVFYLGETAMFLVGIILTGFAGMLIARTLEVRGPGGFVFKSQDASSAAKAIEGATAVNPPATPEQTEGTST